MAMGVGCFFIESMLQPFENRWFNDQPTEFWIFLDNGVDEGSQRSPHPDLGLCGNCQGAMFLTRHWDIRCAVRWFFLDVDPSIFPALGEFEDIQICHPASNTTGLSWELWRVVVCMFILVYLHHNEIFHMNGAHEPFLFANSLEGWDTAQWWKKWSHIHALHPPI